MFSVVSSFREDETPPSLFTNPNVFLFSDEFSTDDSSSILNQPVASPDEYFLAMKPADSAFVTPSSSSVSPPHPLHRSSSVSQPSIPLCDYVCNSTIVTHEPRTYH